MYKLLLCWRYLLTRYLAFACIISVMLGVATLIVVNAVMSGFSTKLRDRLHGLISDIVVETDGLEGFDRPQEKIDRVLADPFLKERIRATAITMEVFALLQFEYPNGETLTRPVRLIGVDAKTRSEVGGFRDFLLDKRNQENPNFDLDDDQRQYWLNQERRLAMQDAPLPPPPLEGMGDGFAPPPAAPVVDPKIPAAVYVGNLIASYRDKDGDDKYVMHRNHPIRLATVSGGKSAPVYDRFVIKDYFKSDMSEYDSNFVFVDLAYLQKLRATADRATSIQIKLHDYDKDGAEVVRRLQSIFAEDRLRIQTWEGKQGPLLAAIDVERKILNVLLFLIVAVAGFGILAIFSMIVAEKTRDIGILKALGASHFGVLQIFLTYGLLLGVVGAGVGTILGVLMTKYINEIEGFLSWLTGAKVFSLDVYYFKEIPTNIESPMIVAVNIGAIVVATVFSVLPALRAAMLHPVRALRYE